MPERRSVVAANWKMNKTVGEAEDFLDALHRRARRARRRRRRVVCPPFTALADGRGDRAGARRSRSAPRTCTRPSPARSPARSRSRCWSTLGVAGAIVGHSERRQLFGETDEALARKVPALLAADLLAILCCGETEAERDAGETEAVLRRQLDGRPGRGRRRRARPRS